MTEDEVDMVNRLILIEAVENQARPVSTSAFIRGLIQRELSAQAPEEKLLTKDQIRKINK